MHSSATTLVQDVYAQRFVHLSVCALAFALSRLRPAFASPDMLPASSSGVEGDFGGVEPDFVGAGGHAVPPTVGNMFVCKMCDEALPFWSLMCYLKAKDKTFHRQGNGDLTKAKAEVHGQKFQQEGSHDAIMLVCLMCAGKEHGKVYMTHNGTPTSQFRNLADLSKGQTSNNKLKPALGNVEQRADRAGKPFPPVVQVMDALTDARISSSTDWVQQVGPNISLHYGCPNEGGCGLYPLRSNNWMRLSQVQIDGGTFEHGRWICGSCNFPWDWSTCGAYRLLIITGSGDEHLVAYVGKGIDEKMSQEITILKGAHLLREIGGRVLNKDTILQAIDVLNADAEKDIILKIKKGIKTATAKDPVHRFPVTKIYCEDHRLSIQRPGCTYQVLEIKPEDSVPTLTERDVSMIIDVASSFMDLEGYWAQRKKFKPAEKQAFARLQKRSKRVQRIVGQVTAGLEEMQISSLPIEDMQSPPVPVITKKKNKITPKGAWDAWD